jgi:S-formylglutathione hydrolase FrmB
MSLEHDDVVGTQWDGSHDVAWNRDETPGRLDVTASSTRLAATLSADGAEPLRHHIAQISLMHGWVPLAVQVIAAVVLACGVGWRSRGWRLRWLPLTALVAVVLAVAAHSYIGSLGVAGAPAPRALWTWIGLTGLALGVLVVGWRSASWGRRGVSVVAVPLCALSCALALNVWVGYFPTVHTAWSQLTARPLPDQIDRAVVTTMQRTRAQPPRGTVVSVSISAEASKFKHRDELVYLPPAWFASDPPPRLPVVMMVGAEFNTPADWLRAGNAVTEVDRFASAHAGNAPVLVFVDPSGAFSNDTECVNGTRGNAADHLTKDVPPYMIENFGVSPAAANWGVAGFSSGGTCAVDLTVMHPEKFSAFVDIAGDLSPNAGTRAQTIARLFGGSAAAWAAYDPATVISRHGRYTAVSGWFVVSAAPQNPRRNVPAGADGTLGAGGRDPVGTAEALTADSLCELGSAHGIACAVVAEPGKHDWPFAAQAFAAALPWLAGHLGTPGVAVLPLPAPSSAVVSPAQPRPALRTEAAGK